MDSFEHLIFAISGRRAPFSKEFKEGLKTGARCWAWWKDGVEYVGTTGRTWREAAEMIDALE